MKRRFFLDVVITKSSFILKLFPGEDKALLVRRNTVYYLVLDQVSDYDGYSH